MSSVHGVSFPAADRSGLSIAKDEKNLLNHEPGKLIGIGASLENLPNQIIQRVKAVIGAVFEVLQYIADLLVETSKNFAKKVHGLFFMKEDLTRLADHSGGMHEEVFDPSVRLHENLVPPSAGLPEPSAPIYEDLNSPSLGLPEPSAPMYENLNPPSVSFVSADSGPVSEASSSYTYTEDAFLHYIDTDDVIYKPIEANVPKKAGFKDLAKKFAGLAALPIGLISYKASFYLISKALQCGSNSSVTALANRSVLNSLATCTNLVSLGAFISALTVYELSQKLLVSNSESNKTT